MKFQRGDKSFRRNFAVAERVDIVSRATARNRWDATKSALRTRTREFVSLNIADRVAVQTELLFVVAPLAFRTAETRHVNSTPTSPRFRRRKKNIGSKFSPETDVPLCIFPFSRSRACDPDDLSRRLFFPDAPPHATRDRTRIFAGYGMLYR